MNTSSARDGKEMSTTVNRCIHLDEHNISQEMSKDINRKTYIYCPSDITWLSRMTSERFDAMQYNSIHGRGLTQLDYPDYPVS
jgi:hypothetical protein